MIQFFNRKKGLQFLKDWVQTEANALLFVYGPKSCGKTTLVTHFIENHLNTKKYAVNYLNLRRVLVYNFASFLDTFFQKNKKDKVREILSGITINVGFFKVGLDDEALLKKNPFKVMEDQLLRAKKKGLQPIIIIDEIQTLKNIYINGERYLIDELFNFFVGLTKEIQAAHIILMTSDSYFIEEIYNNAKLKKTSNFYCIDHFSKVEVTNWLTNQKVASADIDFIWEKLGGSVWEISRVLEKVKLGSDLKSEVEYYLNDEYGKLREYLSHCSEEEEKLILKVHKVIAKNGYALKSDFRRSINQVLPKMVENDFWFYRTDQEKITANSESIRWAMKRLKAIQNNNTTL